MRGRVGTLVVALYPGVVDAQTMDERAWEELFVGAGVAWSMGGDPWVALVPAW